MLDPRERDFEEFQSQNLALETFADASTAAPSFLVPEEVDEISSFVPLLIGEEEEMIEVIDEGHLMVLKTTYLQEETIQ